LSWLLLVAIPLVSCNHQLLDAESRSGLGLAPLVQGQDLRLNELHETTSWPFLEDCYNAHNEYRRQHGVGDLRFNRTLVDYARLKALILAWYDGDVPEDKNNLFGENDYWVQTEESEVTCTEAVKSWHDRGASSWNYEDPHINDRNREFAQVVWRSSRKFGCGQAVSLGSRGGTYTVCYYDPTAKEGSESANVLPPKVEATEA